MFDIIKKERRDQRIPFAQSLIEELDSLYDNLTYDENSPEEVENIKSKIKLREESLRLLLLK
jgi:hypothetical protein